MARVICNFDLPELLTFNLPPCVVCYSTYIQSTGLILLDEVTAYISHVELVFIVLLATKVCKTCF
jgi:hypothetical protein